MPFLPSIRGIYFAKIRGFKVTDYTPRTLNPSGTHCNRPTTGIAPRHTCSAEAPEYFCRKQIYSQAESRANLFARKIRLFADGRPEPHRREGRRGRASRKACRHTHFPCESTLTSSGANQNRTLCHSLA